MAACLPGGSTGAMTTYSATRTDLQKRLVQRNDRKALYVPVQTRPALHGCWSVNISATGIGLIASPLPGDAGPKEGDVLELELALPGTGARLYASGEVRWRHDGNGDDNDLVSLGVSFIGFAEEDHVSLFRYLLGYQPQVLAAFPRPEEVRLLEEAVAGRAQLQIARTSAELHRLVSRGDVAALCLCGGDESLALELTDQLHRGDLEAADDLLPRIIYCAPTAPSRLFGLFNSGAIFRAVTPPMDAASLRSAIDAALREHGRQTEQRRMALELERNLLRDRALVQPAPAAELPPTAGFESEPMQRVLELLRAVAPQRTPVLLHGESGSGKETLARTLHQLSNRDPARFVVLDPLLGVTEELLAAADGGTLFVDGLERANPLVQARLIRLIESAEVGTPEGVRTVDVRVIASCAAELEADVRLGRFRADLYYRLAGFTVEVPALRERRDDVLPLAELFISSTLNHDLRKACSGIAEDARQVLLAADWPGNVRELRSLLERAVLLCPAGAPITKAHLPESFVRRAEAIAEQGPAPTLRERVEDVERASIQEVLRRHHGDLRAAAALLGMEPSALARRARRYGLWEGVTPAPKEPSA